MLNDVDTIEFFKSKAIFQRLMSGHTCKSAATLINTFMGGEDNFERKAGRYNPDKEALRFYLHNHAWSEVLKVSPHILSDNQQQIANTYIKQTSEGFIRMTWYVLLIITRESRHVHASESFYSTVTEKFGEVYCKFLRSLHGTGGEGAAAKFKNNPPKMNLTDYVGAVAYTFNHGGFGHSYGGKPWGNIADTLHRCLLGELSPEMFIDTSFTLCHNGGPIFNKGMIYDMYDQKYFNKHLDVQRSGQIPAYIKELAEKNKFTDIMTEVKTIEKLLGYSLGEYVDWYQVEALGALHSYNDDKAKQVAKYGTPDYLKAEEATKAVAEANKFYINKSVYVTKIQRKLAA